MKLDKSLNLYSEIIMLCMTRAQTHIKTHGSKVEVPIVTIYYGDLDLTKNIF